MSDISNQILPPVLHTSIKGLQHFFSCEIQFLTLSVRRPSNSCHDSLMSVDVHTSLYNDPLEIRPCNLTKVYLLKIYRVVGIRRLIKL